MVNLYLISKRKPTLGGLFEINMVFKNQILLAG